VGFETGGNIVNGSGNIYIGSSVAGSGDEAAVIRIGTPDFNGAPYDTFVSGIYGRPVGPAPLTVMCGSDGKLTANASSRRFKHDIKPIDKASEAILALKPVTFLYNEDPTDTPWFGLIAEDVAEVNPDLIVRDKEGKPFGVRYEQVNAMLLNEFLKARRQIDAQQKQIDALTAGLQKVSAQLELSKPTPQTVLNSH
jgi:hypothetical protein